jgi:hypothetical protein
MKPKSQTLEESKQRIQSLMNYNSQELINEEDLPDSINEQAQDEIWDSWINSRARKVNRWMEDINGVMKVLQNRTYKGGSALEAFKKRYKEKYGQDLPNNISLSGQPSTQPQAGTPQPTQPTQSVGQKTADGYKVVAGTPEDPYVYGTSGSGIKSIQQNLGFTGTDLDGKWGPNTQKALAAKVPDVKQFTNNELSNILQKIRGSQPISKVAGVTQPSMTQTPNNTQLAGAANKGGAIASTGQGFKGV